MLLLWYLQHVFRIDFSGFWLVQHRRKGKGTITSSWTPEPHASKFQASNFFNLSYDFNTSIVLQKAFWDRLKIYFEWRTWIYIHDWMTGYSQVTYRSAMPFCQVQCPCSTQHSQAMSTKAGTPYYVAPQARGVVDIKIWGAVLYRYIFCNFVLVFQHHEVRCCRETTITLVIFGVVESSCEELSGLVLKLCRVQFIWEWLDTKDATSLKFEPKGDHPFKPSWSLSWSSNEDLTWFQRGFSWPLPSVTGLLCSVDILPSMEKPTKRHRTKWTAINLNSVSRSLPKATKWMRGQFPQFFLECRSSKRSRVETSLLSIRSLGGQLVNCWTFIGGK